MEFVLLNQGTLCWRFIFNGNALVELEITVEDQQVANTMSTCRVVVRFSLANLRAKLCLYFHYLSASGLKYLTSNTPLPLYHRTIEMD